MVGEIGLVISVTCGPLVISGTTVERVVDGVEVVEDDVGENVLWDVVKTVTGDVAKDVVEDVVKGIVVVGGIVVVMVEEIVETVDSGEETVNNVEGDVVVDAVEVGLYDVV